MSAREEVLERRIEYVADKVSALEVLVDEGNPTDKGYMEIMNAYNNWSDLYTQLVDEYDNLDEIEAKKERLESEKRIDTILRVAEVGVKVAGIGVSVLAIMASVGVAKLSYTQDQQLVLRNGNVMANYKDLMQMAKIKVV